MKKRVISLSLAAAMMLTMTGCGNKNSEKASGENLQLSWFTTNSNMPADCI